VNTADAARAVTLAGGGFAMLIDFSIGADVAAGRLVRLLPDWAHILIQKPQRRCEEYGRLRKEVLGCQTRLGLLLALGFREYEDDECRTTCAFTPFSRDRRLNDLSAVCF